MSTILCGNLQVTAYEIIRCLPFFLYQRLIQSIIDLAGSMESWRFTDGNKRWHCTSGLISNLLLSAKKYVLGRDALLHISVPLSACKEWLNHGQVQVPFTFYMALPTRDVCKSLSGLCDCLGTAEETEVETEEPSATCGSHRNLTELHLQTCHSSAFGSGQMRVTLQKPNDTPVLPICLTHALSLHQFCRRWKAGYLLCVPGEGDRQDTDLFTFSSSLLAHLHWHFQ